MRIESVQGVMTLALDRDVVIDAAFRSNAPDVYRLVFSIVRERQAAEDVTQDTFARAYERFSAFDDSRPIKGWLHSIATHLAIDHLRRARVRGLVGMRGPRSIPLGEPTVPDATDSIAEREAISGLLDELPARARAMLVLRHAYGYDDRSIAAFVGTSPGNVRTQISRAHHRLRSILASPQEPCGDAHAHGSRQDGGR